MGTVVLVICRQCEAEIRPLLGDKYTFKRKPGRRDKWMPLCMPCAGQDAEARREELVAQAGS
jgi:hypothetical protein